MPASRDIAQFERVREEATRYGIPVIVWAYPRGKDVEKRGGKDSPFAVEYAARVALELGADVIKVNIPHYDPTRKDQYPGGYRELAVPPLEAMRRVVQMAGRALVIASGGGAGGPKKKPCLTPDWRSRLERPALFLAATFGNNPTPRRCCSRSNF
ncbi:MAG: hypothetical protein M1157_01530 [Deinococcus sp.]|nr:hypothetical protein [Deinococcus sp.]